MKFQQAFDIEAPRETVWPLLLDLERVVPCLPGARIIERIDDRSYRAAVKLRLGPMSLNYEGEIRLAEVDDDSYRALLRGKANEARGQGTAAADIDLHLTATDSGTHADMDVDLALAGKVAQMGGRMVEDVSRRLLQQFAECLSETVGGEGSEDSPAGATGSAGEGTERSGPTVGKAAEAEIRPLRLLLAVIGERLRGLFRRRARKASRS